QVRRRRIAGAAPAIRCPPILRAAILRAAILWAAPPLRPGRLLAAAPTAPRAGPLIAGPIVGRWGRWHAPIVPEPRDPGERPVASVAPPRNSAETARQASRTDEGSDGPTATSAILSD